MSIVAKKIMMGSGAVATPSDDEFNRVSFLSHFDGANNGVNNAFDDGSASNHTITAAGNVTQGSFGPFARPAGHFSQRNYASAGGTTSQTSWVEAPDSADFDLVVTGDFTIEFWVNFIKTEATIIFGQSNGGGGQPKWNLNLDQAIADNLAFHLGGGGNLGVPFAPDANRWYYIAVTRDGNNYRFYADGAQLGSTVSSSARSSASSAVLQIGAGESYLGLGGYISNLRFVKGTALYTGSTHAVPTGPTTKVTNTVLLCCQDNSFIDNSDSAHVLTPNKLTLANYAEVSTFGPFLTSKVYDAAVNGASLASLAAGDYLSFGNIGLDGHSGDFSIEAWIYPTAYSQYSNTIYSQGSNANVSDLFELSLNASGQLHAFINQGSVTLQSTFVCNRNAWTFVQLKRTSGTLAIFTNGTQSSTVSNTATIASPNRGFVGTQSYGAGVASRSFFGFICDVRCSVVTRSISLPTAPLAVTDSNTKLLLNMADGQAFDSAAQSNLYLAGNAKISTAHAKFGNTSLALGGDQQVAEIVSSNVINFGAGPFTIEMFLRLDSGSTNRTEIFFDGRGDAGSQGLFPTLEIKHTDDTVDYYTNSNIKISSGTLTRGQFYHIAVCRSGTSTKMFIDGTQVGSTYSDSAFYISSSRVQLGRYYASTNHDFHGEIDELRISKMARYTSNFTAPSAPFADKGQ